MKKKLFLVRKVLLVLACQFLVLAPSFASSDNLNNALALGNDLTGFIQQPTVRGTITDTSGLPLAGVSVVEKGTTNGVVTDFDGNYEITVSSNESILEFSYLGYGKVTRAVGSNQVINVSMEETTSELDEVVVIGYGTTKKSDLTGSVVSVSAKDIEEVPAPSVTEALTGRVAGLQVVTTDGSPDAGINVRIRGGGSISQDSSPLLIVDGFPVNSIDDIAPSNIESISVLKDASATAIYGSRGAYGVIIVTTKTGKDGKISVSANSFYGMMHLANTVDVLGVEDYVSWQYEYAMIRDNLSSYENIFGSYQDRDLYNGVQGNNWQKQVYGRTGEIFSQDLSITGGSEKANFNFTFARYDLKAIQVGSDYLRNNLSLKFKSKVNEKVDLGFTVRYADIEINGSGANEQNEASSADSRLKHSISYSPLPLPGLTTDDTDPYSSTSLIDPFVALADNDRLQNRKNYNMLGSFGWKIFDNVKFNADLGFDNYNYLDYRFYGRQTYYANNQPLTENQGMPALIIRDRKDHRFRTANTLDINFGKYINNDNHNLKLLLGHEYVFFESNQVTDVLHGFPDFFSFDQARKLTTQGSPFSVENYYSPDDKLLSFFGRLNYDFKNRYLFTATFRADASSRFLGNNRWGYFPSAALAWKVNEEAFLKNVKWLDALKLRVSYGQAGNNNIPVGQTAKVFVPGITSYINGVDSYWAPSDVLENPDLKWETMVTRNIGMDFSLFNGRLGGTFEVYRNTTKDLLLEFRVPGSGYDTQFRNVGENQNEGIEVALNAKIIDKPDYGIDFSFNISKNTNEIISLGSLEPFNKYSGWASSDIPYDFLVSPGESLGVMVGYKNDGRYEVSDFDYVNGEYILKDGVADATEVLGNQVVPGSMKLKDINGDGIVDIDDITKIGNAQPDFTGGFVLNAFAYGFDLTAAFNFSYGNDVYNANKIEYTTANRNGQYRNLGAEMASGSRWTNIDPSTGSLVTDPTQLEALNANTTMWSPYMNNYVFSDWAVEDGSFLRLNTLTLGYSLPNSAIEKIGLTKLRFYLTGYNVALWTSYSGLDPEASTRRKDPFTPGVDYSAYPRSRQFIFGVNLNF
ncbi:MAG: TonB-dependent receptor [Mangrovimonas sp.]|nr:TonB-dependent receptor [Mangrovimonas sp.]